MDDSQSPQGLKEKWKQLRYQIRCANRQYRHNNDNSPDLFSPRDGFVVAYSNEAVESALNEFEMHMAGKVLVPVEPSPKMIDATFNDEIETSGEIESHNTRNRRIYKAMLTASKEGV